MILEDEERVGRIQKVVEKLRNGSRTKSSNADLAEPEKSIKFSEESSRTIHELGNIEFHELGQISRTVQCRSFLKHIPEGLTFCACGICLRLDEETIHRIKAKFQAAVVPYYFARVNYSRGKRHGEISIAKRPLERAMDARRGANKKGHNSIVIRCSESSWMDRRILAIPGPPHDNRHLFYRTLAPEAPVRGTITLVCNDDGRQARPMRARKGFKLTTKILTSLRQEQGRQNSFIPKNERVRQRPFGEALPADQEWQNNKLENLLVATFLFIILTTMVATRPSRHSMARTPRHSMARSQLVGRVMAADSFKDTQDFFFTDFAYIHRRMSCTRREGEDRTLRRTHMFLSLVGVVHLIAPLTFHTHMRVAQDMIGTCCTSAHSQKSSTHSTFHRPLFSTCLTRVHRFVHVTSVDIELTVYGWNQESLLCYSARMIAVWPSG